MIRTMVDSTGVVTPPNGVTVAAFYLAGNGASRGWPSSEVATAKTKYAALLPIQVAYLDFSQPELNAKATLRSLEALGITNGAIALDIEAKVADRAVAANYPSRWAAEIRKANRYSLGYTSRSTVYAVNGCDGKWVAGYDNNTTLEGYEAHQYADVNEKYDLSSIDDSRVPLWGLSSGPTPPPPTYGKLAAPAVGAAWCTV